MFVGEDHEVVGHGCLPSLGKAREGEGAWDEETRGGV